MRLIDADALVADTQFFDGHEWHYGYTEDEIKEAPTIAAPRWVRCEEPPKEDGWYMLCYLSRWENGSWWIPDFPDYWVEPPKEDV